MNILQLILAFIGALAAVAGAWVAVSPKFRQWLRIKNLTKRLPKEFFTKDEIDLSTRYYIEPFCSEENPESKGEDSNKKKNYENLFQKFDEFVSKATLHPFMWLLSDSGTGKTSFVLNFYAQRKRRLRRKRLRMEVIPLGLPGTEEYINKIDDNKRARTILLLDGFDEDTDATGDYERRFKQLVNLSKDFKRVLITCRTQFFPSADAIPCKTEIERPGPRQAALSGFYDFTKLYLTPFTDKQVKSYLKKCLTIRFWKKRKRAFELVKRMPKLTMRPMLLAYIPDLIERGKTFEYTFEL